MWCLFLAALYKYNVSYICIQQALYKNKCAEFQYFENIMSNATHVDTSLTAPVVAHHLCQHVTYATLASTSPTLACNACFTRWHFAHISKPPTPPSLARIADYFSYNYRNCSQIFKILSNLIRFLKILFSNGLLSLLKCKYDA